MSQIALTCIISSGSDILSRVTLQREPEKQACREVISPPACIAQAFDPYDQGRCTLACSSIAQRVASSLRSTTFPWNMARRPFVR